jgi:hypothetical protein
MGISTLDIVARAEPVTDEEVKPFPLTGLTCVYRVGRWPYQHKISWLWRQIYRFGCWWDNIPVCMPFEDMGVFATREEAKGTCLDETYNVTTLPFGELLPEERVRSSGFFIPKLRFNLWHVEPKEKPSNIVPVKRSDIDALEAAMNYRLGDKK